MITRLRYIIGLKLVAWGMRLVPARVANAVALGLRGDNLTHVGARFGFERELDEPFRKRITDHVTRPPFSGSADSIKARSMDR